MEVWLNIYEFPDYEISSQGRVRNTLTNRILKPGNVNGYQQVILCRDKKHYPKYIHVLVADRFFDGAHTGLDVNHNDSRRGNNFVGNLEWMSRSDNIKHAYQKGYKIPSGPHKIRKVRIKETGLIFDNATECAKYIGGYRSHVSACLRGELSTHKGYSFEFIGE